MRTNRCSRWIAALCAFALAGLALGCFDEPKGPTAEEFAREAEASKERAKMAAKAREKKQEAKAVAKAQKAPTVTPAPDLAAGNVDTAFSYDPTGKRDPFRSFMWERPDRLAQAEIQGPLEQFDLTQLEVVAVVWRTGNSRALVQDPSGQTYIIGEGTPIGKNQGHVVGIGDNSVMVKETYVDYLGQETTKDVEMRMRRNEGG